MRVLFWYCNAFSWVPAVKTLEDAPEAVSATHENTVVAFVHVEPADLQPGSQAETKLVKNAKWRPEVGRSKCGPPFLYAFGGRQGRAPRVPKPFGPGGEAFGYRRLSHLPNPVRIWLGFSGLGRAKSTY